MVHIGPLSQLLLSEAGLLAIFANRFAKSFPLEWPVHDLLRKQERQALSTQYAVYSLKLFPCTHPLPVYHQRR